MAGMAGFEPTRARVKVSCLTAWRHPIILCSAFASHGRFYHICKRLSIEICEIYIYPQLKKDAFKGFTVCCAAVFCGATIILAKSEIEIYRARILERFVNHCYKARASVYSQRHSAWSRELKRTRF